MKILTVTKTIRGSYIPSLCKHSLAKIDRRTVMCKIFELQIGIVFTTRFSPEFEKYKSNTECTDVLTVLNYRTVISLKNKRLRTET